MGYLKDSKVRVFNARAMPVTLLSLRWVSSKKPSVKLPKLQGMACVCITGAMCTCPTVAIEVLMAHTAP